MQTRLWENTIEASADSRRAQGFFEQLKSASGASIIKKASAEQVRVLVSLFSGSQALSEWLLAHPDCLEMLEPEKLRHPRQKQGLSRDVRPWLDAALKSNDFTRALAKLRDFKQRQMLRIAARDLSRMGSLTEIVEEISAVADVCLDAVLQLCAKQLTERLGMPYHQDANGRWVETAFCVLGMGKLGGRELNYSSDVDVLFVYSAEGSLFKVPPKRNEPPGKGMSNHQFFCRLAEAFIGEVGRMTSEGFLFRIDLRLRPEGGAGPLARARDSDENA